MKPNRIVSTITLGALFATLTPATTFAADDRKAADPAAAVAVADTTAPPMIPVALTLSRATRAGRRGAARRWVMHADFEALMQIDRQSSLAGDAS
jgi:hypothetical protein